MNIELRKGSSLSSLLFIMVIELVNRWVKMKRILEKIYADDVAVVAESKCEIQEVLVEWKEAYGEDGGNVGQPAEEKKMNIRLQGKEIR